MKNKELNDKLHVEEIKEIADIFSKLDVTELEYENGGVRIYLSKQQPAHTYNISGMAPHGLMQQPVTTVTAPALTESVPSKSANFNDHPGCVKSPMVGTAYVASAPGAAPFVKVGDTVAAGQTILIVEAMKVMNQIKAPKAGVVSHFLVADAMPVEYAQPLIVIE